MERDEWIGLFILWTFFGLIGYSLAGGELWGLVFACLIVTFPGLVIIRYFKYNKKYGLYRLPPFACHIYDESGLLASFKGKDWTLDEAPKELVTEKTLRIKKYNVEEERFENQNQTIELNFLDEYYKLLDEFLKQFISNPGEGEQSLDFLIKKTGNPTLIAQYQKLTAEEKINVAELARALLALRFGLATPPKVYPIASLTNGVYIYWFAFAPPNEYATYRTKQVFRKWNIVPWVSGFPVVEMWGKETNELMMIGGRQLRIILAMPLQDENYRKEKYLNIKKYSIIASALSVYTEKVLDALPTLAFLDLIQRERDRYKEEKEIYKQGLLQTTADIAAVSSTLVTALSMVSRAAGAISKLPEVPESIKKELERVVPLVSEEKSRLERIKERLTSLVTGEKPPTKPPTISVPTEEKKEEEKVE